MNLTQLIEISNQLKVQGSINPGTHLSKLLKSHGFNDLQQPASEFFYSILNEEAAFFDAKNMPSTWSFRSLSGVMESLHMIIEAPEVTSHLKEEMGDEHYDSLLKLIDDKRRNYVSETKKHYRSLHEKDETSTNTVTQEPTQPQPTSVVSAPQVHDTQVHDTQVHDTNDDVPQQADAPFMRHVEKALWILEKYIEGEKDEFKLIVLELLEVELTSIKKSLQT